MTDEEAFLYDAETELRRARRTGSRRAARDFAQAYIGERTDRNAAEPYDVADAVAYDVESEATKFIRERRRRRRKPGTGNFWKDAADDALNGGQAEARSAVSALSPPSRLP
jgi:hypothetical protein